MTDDERREMHTIAAQAKIVLTHEAPASRRVDIAILALERLLPPSGTPEHRAAFQAAHNRLAEPCE
jgi:hypothetical protein